MSSAYAEVRVMPTWLWFPWSGRWAASWSRH